MKMVQMKFLSGCYCKFIRRNTLDKIIANSSRNIFVPITVGGGIKKLEDIELILKLVLIEFL